MTQQECDKAKQEYWEEFKQLGGQGWESKKYIFDFAFDHAYALGKQTQTTTQEEIEKAAEKHADELRVISGITGALVPMLYNIAKSSYLQGAQDFLGKQEKDAEETVIQGWVARDKNGDLVCCAGSKPFKEEKLPFWRVDFRNFIECIPNDLFPDLTWDSDPIEVELIIKRKNNGNIQ